MATIPEAVASKLAHLPDTPGVYLWKAADGTVLYVGKAKRLRPRVRSYYADQALSPKTQMLMARQLANPVPPFPMIEFCWNTSGPFAY